jgi:hypothetical protein
MLHAYEIRPRKDHRGVDVISDALPVRSPLTLTLLLSDFSPGDKIENCSAQFLAVCWIAHVEFKVHRLRDGFSVSNALLLVSVHDILLWTCTRTMPFA